MIYFHHTCRKEKNTVQTENMFAVYGTIVKSTVSASLDSEARTFWQGCTCRNTD